MKKRLLFVIPELRNGGAERVASILLNEAVKRSYEVTLLLVLGQDVCYELEDSICVVALPKRMTKSRWIPKAVSIISAIRRVIQDTKPDIVVSFMTTMNMYTVLANWGLHVPVIGSERNAPGMERNSFVRSLFMKLCYKKIDGMIFQTEDAKAYFAGIKMKSSTVIPNPVKNNLPLWVSEFSSRKCVAVGRLEKQKNYPLLLQAFSMFRAKHPDYSLDIYGEGSCREELERMIDQMGLEECVFLRGVHQDVHSMIKNAEMFVMTSDFEGIPNALLESLAMGIPSVATDCPCGGVKMLMKNGKNGCLVPVGDAEAVSQKMCDIIENMDEALQMSRRATKDMEQYTETAICERYFSYFSSRMGI